VSEVFEYISWVKDWEGSAENPTELLTSFTIMNISDYLIPNLLRLARQTENNKISFENYEIKVLGILADLIKSKSREVEAISEFQWRTIGDIVALLSPLCLDKSHIQSLTQLLKIVSATCHSDKYLQKLLSLICGELSTGNDHGNRLPTLTSLAIQCMLSKYSLQYVKSFPRRIFADSKANYTHLRVFCLSSLF
jgi:hypothetical protein